MNYTTRRCEVRNCREVHPQFNWEWPLQVTKYILSFGVSVVSLIIWEESVYVYACLLTSVVFLAMCKGHTLWPQWPWVKINAVPVAQKPVGRFALGWRGGRLQGASCELSVLKPLTFEAYEMQDI